ncbi:MAG TPA: hypothetical protein VGJ66_10095 [Pyrinomonadaceae bacterium]
MENLILPVPFTTAFAQWGTRECPTKQKGQGKLPGLLFLTMRSLYAAR